uniref:Ig-like domain-containing protein n=1 Tax=Romanomermis culicivorax TaxID=13658 RepID=A0A915L5X2_ROMCU
KVRVQVKKNLPTLTDLPIGKRVEIECTVGPFNKQITWTWLKDGEILSRANADAVETTSGLRVRLALVMTESSSGQYVVRVTYPNGLTKTCPAFLVNVNKKLPSVSEEKPGSVDNCKNGIFNKVFYESDVPKYCVINEDGPNDGLCMDMNNLYYKLKPFVTRQVREQKNKDWTYEYKRYNLQGL